jgi:hypothetical protein
MLLNTVQWQRMQRFHNDLDAVIARIYSCRNSGTTNVEPKQKDRSLSHRRGGPFRSTNTSRREQKSRPWICMRLKPGMTVLAKPSSSPVSVNLSVVEQSVVSSLRRSWAQARSPLVEQYRLESAVRKRSPWALKAQGIETGAIQRGPEQWNAEAEKFAALWCVTRR